MNPSSVVLDHSVVGNRAICVGLKSLLCEGCCRIINQEEEEKEKEKKIKGKDGSCTCARLRFFFSKR